jgi:hypothetical protein
MKAKLVPLWQLVPMGFTYDFSLIGGVCVLINFLFNQHRKTSNIIIPTHWSRCPRNVIMCRVNHVVFPWGPRTSRRMVSLLDSYPPLVHAQHDYHIVHGVTKTFILTPVTQICTIYPEFPRISMWMKLNICIYCKWYFCKLLWHRERCGSRVVHCGNIIRSGAGLQFLGINNFFTCIWTILWHIANLLTFFFV